MASDVAQLVLATKDLGPRIDLSEIDLIGTPGLQLYDTVNLLLVHAYSSGSFLRVLPLHPVLEAYLSGSKVPNYNSLSVINMKQSGSRIIIQPNLKIVAYFTMMIEKLYIFIKENL